MFPTGIPEIIADYAAKYELTERAKKYEHLFSINSLSSNPRACDYILDKLQYSPQPQLIIDNVDWFNLSKNPGASEFYRECPYYIEIEAIGSLSFPWVRDMLIEIDNERDQLDRDVMIEISKNPTLIDIIIKNLNTADSINLCENHTALDILIKNPNRIEWDILSKQPWAISFIEQNLDKVNWSALSGNPAAIHILNNNPEKINWRSANLLGNIPLLEMRPEKIKWRELSECVDNVNNVGSFLRKHIDKINWKRLSFNPMHIDILRENPEHIDWDELLENMGGGGDLLLTLPDDEIDWPLMAYNEEIFEARRSEEMLAELYNL